MGAHVGDRLVILGRHIHQPVRQGEIIEVLGRDGGPPYRVRWDDTGHDTLLYPGSDALIEHPTTASSAAPGGLGAPARAPDGSSILPEGEVVSLLRQHLDLEKIRTTDYDRELWDLWNEEVTRSIPSARVAAVLDRVLARVRAGE